MSRISVRDENFRSIVKGNTIRIYFDGVEQIPVDIGGGCFVSLVQTADEEGGYIDQNMPDGKGGLEIDEHNNWIEKRLMGKVKIVMEPK